MDVLVENRQPESWLFWLGAQAYALAPPYVCIPGVLDFEGVDLRPGWVTYVAMEDAIRWGWLH